MYNLALYFGGYIKKLKAWGGQAKIPILRGIQAFEVFFY